MEHKAFLIVTKAVLADKRISVTAKLLLAQLCDHWNKRTGQCFPHEATLARELGISRWTVMRALRQLKAAGMLDVKRTQRGNRYEFPKLQSATSQVAESHFPKLQNRTLRDAHPLYEPDLKEPSGVPAASSRNKNSFNPPLPPRKSAQSEVLEAYYREERRKAGR